MKSKLNILIVPLLFVLFTALSYWNFSSYNSINKGNLFSSPELSMKGVEKEDRQESIKEMLAFQFNRLKDVKTNEMPKNFRQNELKFAEDLPSAKPQRLSKGGNTITTSAWLSEGPINQGGRTKAIVPDISNENILIAAAAAGGIWRSTDQGATWINTLSPSYIQNVTCLTQDTRAGKTNIWYAGTGELQSNTSFFFAGDGIFKSVDNGLTWHPLASTQVGTPQSFVSRFQVVWNIEIDKVHDLIYAAVAAGIYCSADGGDNWTLAITGSGNYTSISVNENGRAFAAIGDGDHNGIYYSDNGTNWTNITPSFWASKVYRIVTDVSKSNPNILYVLANTPGVGQPGDESEGTDGYISLWKFDASTSVWTNLTSNLPAYTAPVGGYTSQYGYDMLIKVKPNDENFVVIGGTNLFRTTDGFATKLTNADWIGGYAVVNDISQYENHHPDQHAFYYLNSNPNIVYSAHDGGISKSSDITASTISWSSLNPGYVTTQFWNVALDKAVSNGFILGGMQDNGTMVDQHAFTTSKWVSINSGDGTFAAIADHSKFFYTSSQNGNIYRMTVAGEWAYVTPANASNLLFVAPFILDPNNTDVMYLLDGNKIWRNSNLTEIPAYDDNPTNKNWILLNGSVTGSSATALAMSKSSNNLLYVGDDSGKLFKILDASNISSPFTEITGTNFPAGYISTIAVDPNNGNNVLVGFSNYNILSLFFSSNGGTSWTEVGGNLEENADGSGTGPSIRSVKILPVNDGYVYYAATSIGVFSTSSLNGRNTIWALEAPNSIGNTVVETMDIRELDGTVIAGTFGKGVYSTKVGSTSSAKPVTNVQSLTLKVHPGETGSTSFILSNEGTAPLTYNVSITGDLLVAPPINSYNQILKSNVNSKTKRKLSDFTTHHSSKLNRVKSNSGKVLNKSFNLLGSDILYLDDGNAEADNFVGWMNVSDFYWANVFFIPTSTYLLEEVEFFMRTENATSNNIYVGVFNSDGDELAGGNLNFDLSPDGTWYSVTVNPAINFNKGDTLSIMIGTLSSSIYTPAGVDISATTPNNSYYLDGTDWINLNTFSGYENGAFIIRAIGTASTVSNKPPVAVANVTPTQANVNTSISFNGASSHDDDGTITKYEWNFGDGANSNQATVQHSYSHANTYTYTLKVTDDKGATNQATGTVTISQTGSAKVIANPSSGSIDAGGSQTITLTLDAATIAEGSYNGEIKISTNGGNILLPIGYIVDVNEDAELPMEYTLKQNYPNPFNPSTIIEFAIPKSDDVSLKVYDLLGREVVTLVNKRLSAGNYKVKFDASTINKRIASGIYIYRLQTNEYSDTKKFILIK